MKIAALFSIIIPVAAGLTILIKRSLTERKTIHGIALSAISAGYISILLAMFGQSWDIQLLELTEKLTVYFRPDKTGAFFSVMVGISVLLSSVYATKYMEHEGDEWRFFGFLLCTYGAINALCMAGNITTYYFCYEIMTCMSFPLVLHTRTKAAIMAGLKYLIYSLAGAYFVLFGIYFVARYAPTLAFTQGGVFDADSLRAGGVMLMVAAASMIMGFSVKAGMFPLHGWLPTAHPVAPAPASAIFSGILVKTGVLGIIRVVYYIFGTGILGGTRIQSIFVGLSLTTVFMGSMLAYREKVLKKRFAYSTVSQISYILFGIFVMDGGVALKGSYLHIMAHVLIKTGLFLFAGAIIFCTGKTRVDELKGLGRRMPVLFGCYTILSLGLVGIPPTGGFTSKWFLCTGALEGLGKAEGFLGAAAYAGPAALLVSALLTAGYLFPIAIDAFLPGEDFDESEVSKYREPDKRMLIPIAILTLLSVVIGLAVPAVPV